MLFAEPDALDLEVHQHPYLGCVGADALGFASVVPWKLIKSEGWPFVIFAMRTVPTRFERTALEADRKTECDLSLAVATAVRLCVPEEVEGLSLNYQISLG